MGDKEDKKKEEGMRGKEVRLAKDAAPPAPSRGGPADYCYSCSILPAPLHAVFIVALVIGHHIARLRRNKAKRTSELGSGEGQWRRGKRGRGKVEVDKLCACACA